MFRSRVRFCALAAALLALNAAGLVWIRQSLLSRNIDKVRVLAALPARDVDSTDRFTLVFDEPVAAAELVGQPLPKSPFRIDPQPPGRWIWAARDRLEYRLDRPLPPGNVFRISPADQFELLTGQALAGKTAFEFRTRALKLETCEFTAVDRNLGQVTFTFNQPVSPHELGKHLSINGQRMTAGAEPQPSSRPIGPPLATAGSSNQHAAAAWVSKDVQSKLVLLVRRPPGDHINIEIEGSLTGAQGNLPLGKVFKTRCQFDRAFKLDSAYVSPASFGNPTVSLDFSHYLDRSQTAPQVLIDPPVKGVWTSIEWDEVQLHGPFEPGRRYTATVAADVLAEDGATLGETQTISFEIPDRSPDIRFAAKRGILNPHGNLSLDMEAVNVSGVHVSVSRVTANNVVSHLRGEETAATSRDVIDRTLAMNLRHNHPAAMAVELRELLADPLGIYRLRAESSENSWDYDDAVVSITDLAITAKTERDGLWAWVTSLSTGKPAAGVNVKAVSYNNQVLAQGITDLDGTVRMSVPDGPDGPVWVVIAEHGEDLAYLQPDRRQWVLDDVDQSGRPVPEHYDVMLYTERGAYRPGDTIYVTGIVRDAMGHVPPEFPLSLVIRRPDGRQVETLTVTTADNDHGLFQAEYATDESAQLGPYAFEVSIPGSDSILRRTTPLVEAFLPVRFEVDATPSSSRYGRSDTPELAVAAQYLFGKPAAGLPCTVTGRYRSVSFRSTNYPGFNFDDPEENKDESAAVLDFALDDNGVAAVSPDTPEAARKGGLWRAEWSVTVTEPGSRSVSKSTSAVIDNLDHHLGLYSSAGRIVPVAMPVEIEWIQLTGADELAEPQPATIGLYRVEYDWVIKEVHGRRVWQTHERLSQVSQESLASGPDAAARGTYVATFPSEGHYRVIATDDNSQQRTSIEIHAAADRTQAELLALNRPERLELVLDQDQYAPGSTASILVRSPFPGTLMLAIESDRVVSHQVTDVTGNSTTIELPIPSELRGGAFVTGTLVRPIDPERDQWLPHRAMGMARLLIDHAESNLEVLISAPDEAQPGESITVSAAIAGPIDPDCPPLVHLWAVDEGILLPTNYQTPDPRKYFFAPRKSSVATSDVFADLLLDIKRPDSMENIGADADGKDPEQIRRNPVTVKLREPAVIWNSIVSVDSNGEATWNVELPDAIGRLRFMAVAVDRDRYGTTDHGLTLTAPLLVEANWPRFVAPGDRIDVPVKLFSSLDEPIDVSLTLDIDGPLDIAADENLHEVRVEPDSPTTIWLVATATASGPIYAKVTAVAGNTPRGTLHAKSEGRFPCRPPAPPHVESTFVRILPDQPVTIDPSPRLVADTTRTTVRISSQPSVELMSAFEAVVDYPYGCVEQTTSRLYALLYAQSLFERSAPEDIRTRSIPHMIQSGIARLYTMQTRGGGLAYWPGGTEPHVWGSAYACGFLAEARMDGYPIDESFLKHLTGFLESALRPGRTHVDDPNTRAMLCRVLAELDAPPTGWMTQLAERAESLDREGRVHLAAAWLAAGRKDRALPLVDQMALDVNMLTPIGERITSPLRQDALLLSWLCDAYPEHPGIAPLAERVRAAREHGRWGNTLENATSLVALSKYQASVPEDVEFAGELLVGDKRRLLFDHTKPAACTLSARIDPLKFHIRGTGVAYANITEEGLLADVSTPGYDHRLQVRRRWTNQDGKAIDPSNLRVGDLIHVEVSLRADAEQSIAHIAIVDALPGGLEVENPRLATSVQSDSSDEPVDVPDRVEFLDDRVLLFASASSQPKRFHYTLRATSAGTFTAPPIQASSMYDGGFASLHGGGKLEIQR